MDAKKGLDMKISWMASAWLLSGISLVTGLGCQNKVQDENIALYNQNRELQAQLTDKDERLKAAPDPAQLASMQREIADRDAKINELRASLNKPAAGSAA